MRTECSLSALLPRPSKPSSWLATVASICILASCTGKKTIETKLQVAVVGNGMVASSESQIQCTSAPSSWCVQNRMRFDGEAMYNPVTNLTAKPNADSVFVGWTGDCTGTGACSVDMSDSNKTVTATFLKVAYKSLSVVHSNGDLTITGTFNDHVDLGSGNIVSAGGVDIFLARFSSAAGTTLWSVGFGSSGSDRPDSLTIDGSGNLVVTGYTNGLITFGATTLDCSAQGGHFSATFAGSNGSYMSSSCLTSSP